MEILEKDVFLIEDDKEESEDAGTMNEVSCHYRMTCSVSVATYCMGFPSERCFRLSLRALCGCGACGKKMFLMS